MHRAVFDERQVTAELRVDLEFGVERQQLEASPKAQRSRPSERS
jgi:hypothetical protein